MTGNLARTTIVGILLLEAAVVLVFAAAATSGDDLGIARAMAVLLSIPFAVFAIVTVVLMQKRYTITALTMALLSAGVMATAWMLA